LAGVGAYSIANIFNAEGIPTKFSGNFTGEITRKDQYTKNKTQFKKSNIKWRGNVISDMLTNKMYKGIREWNRHEDKVSYENQKLIKVKVPVELIIYNDIPVIVEPSLWDAANANLSINRKNVGKKEQYHYLLNGLLRCGYCQNEMLGKKRLKGNDNSYKCKGKRPPHKSCDDSRGISLPKLETFIIQHLFKSRELKKMLVEAPKGGKEVLRLREIKTFKETQRVGFKNSISRISKILIDKDLIDDETFKNAYKDNIGKLKEVEIEIENLITKISEVENDTRNKRTKSLIENYARDVGFVEVKKLVHTLIERIDIHHQKESKSGFFTLNIKYRYYNESSLFATNWQAMRWQWLSHHRKEAYHLEDLKEDKELFAFLLKRKGSKGVDLKDFKGFESITRMHDVIELKADELIQYN
jgi:site-specific DNA recombinase